MLPKGNARRSGAARVVHTPRRWVVHTPRRWVVHTPRRWVVHTPGRWVVYSGRLPVVYTTRRRPVHSRATTDMLRSDRFPVRRLLPYWLAQLLGAVLAGLVVWAVFGSLL